MSRRIRATAMALLVLTASLAAGPGQALGQTATSTATPTPTSGDACGTSVPAPTGPISMVTSLFVNAGSDFVCQYLLTETVNTTGTDAQQVQDDLYSTASTHAAQAEGTLSALNNTVTLSQTRMRRVGTLAYIEAANNGATEAEARLAAHQAINRYASNLTLSLVSSWNATVTQYQYLHEVATNESGVTSSSESKLGGDVTLAGSRSSADDSWQFLGTRIQTVTLPNGSTRNVLGARIQTDVGSGLPNSVTSGVVTPSPSSGLVSSFRDGYGTTKPRRLIVTPPSNTQLQPVTLLNMPRYPAMWSRIEQERQAAIAGVDTVINNTYGPYQRGAINLSQAITPAMAAEDLSPSDGYQTWAVMQLQSMGLSAPVNLSQTGSMVIENRGVRYRGILMSTSNPASGQFSVGETYNASNISGPQYVATPNTTVRLTGQFTLVNATTTDGERMTNVTIDPIEYDTSNINSTQLINIIEELSEDRAETEAREQNMGGSGGPVFPGVSRQMGFAVLGGVALLLIATRQGG